MARCTRRSEEDLPGGGAAGAALQEEQGGMQGRVCKGSEQRLETQGWEGSLAGLRGRTEHEEWVKCGNL